MSKNILYIEDNPDNMMLVRRVLQAGDYNLMEARNGLQGLLLAENHKIDLILLDINLPDIDGYEVARRVRSSTKIEVARTPIIVLTANAMRGDAQKALDAGCDMYLSKPINIFELLEKVDMFMNREARGNIL
jgi:two-component system, cell cycle response regulator DivK